MQILNSHHSVFIAPELLFKHPLKKSLFKLIQKQIEKGHLEDLLTELYGKSNNFKDTFYKTIELVNPDDLFNSLRNYRNLSPYDVFGSILDLAANTLEKSRVGAKFPVHYSFTQELFDNYPDCYVLFLTRDPREIYLSDRKKNRKNSKGKEVPSQLKGGFSILQFSSIQYSSGKKVCLYLNEYNPRKN